MTIKKWFLFIILFFITPFVFIGILPEWCLFFIIVTYLLVAAVFSVVLFPQLQKPLIKSSNRIIETFKLFWALFFATVITIILNPFMPEIFQERLAYVMLTVLLETIFFMGIMTGSMLDLEKYTDEEYIKKLRAEAKELFKKYGKDDKQS